MREVDSPNLRKFHGEAADEVPKDVSQEVRHLSGSCRTCNFGSREVEALVSVVFRLSQSRFFSGVICVTVAGDEPLMVDGLLRVIQGL